MTYITIPGFEDLSEQDVFDASLTFIRGNGQPGMRGNGSCSYKEGCAASIFLTNEAKNRVNGGWGLLATDKQVPEKHFNLVLLIQAAHDNAATHAMRNAVRSLYTDEFNAHFMKRFEESMKDVAYRFELEYKEPTK